MKIQTANGSIPTPLPKPPGEVEVTEQFGKETVTYQRDDQGHVVGSQDNQPVPGWLERTKDKAWSSLVPDNLPNSVSADYVRTRKWQLARDFFGTFAATSSLAAVTTAIGPANTALAAMGVAALNLANVTWIKQRLPQITQFASTGLATVSERIRLDLSYLPYLPLFPLFAFVTRVHSGYAILVEALTHSHLDSSMAPNWVLRKNKF